MKMLDRVTGRTTALTQDTRHLLESTSAHLPQWITTGAALSIARVGSKAALGFARRNPAVLVAAGVVGIGAIAYNAYRKRKTSTQHSAQHLDTDRSDDTAGALALEERATDTGSSKRRAPKSTARRTQRKSGTVVDQA